MKLKFALNAITNLCSYKILSYKFGNELYFGA